jgi:hypothetical protein
VKDKSAYDLSDIVGNRGETIVRIRFSGLSVRAQSEAMC